MPCSVNTTSDSEANAKRWRFTLIDIFVVVTGICIFIALIPTLALLGRPPAESWPAYRCLAAFVGTCAYVIARWTRATSWEAFVTAGMIGIFVVAIISLLTGAWEPF